ncbi:GIY-YIG domain-containing protein [Gammaproteobacteria bacterium]
MGFLSGLVIDLLNIGSNVLENVANQSALPPGRMNETDKIKGSDSPLPNSPGVYRHINKENGNVDYIGESKDLRKRQQEHTRSGKLDTDKQYVQYGVAKDTASTNDRRKTEVNHIARHAPPGNTTKGGNGRK